MRQPIPIRRRVIVLAGVALAVSALGVGVVHAQVPTCGPHEDIVDDGGTLVCRELDPSIEPDCPAGRAVAQLDRLRFGGLPFSRHLPGPTQQPRSQELKMSLVKILSFS